MSTDMIGTVSDQCVCTASISRSACISVGLVYLTSMLFSFDIISQYLVLKMIVTVTYSGM